MCARVRGCLGWECIVCEGMTGIALCASYGAEERLARCVTSKQCPKSAGAFLRTVRFA